MGIPIRAIGTVCSSTNLIGPLMELVKGEVQRIKDEFVTDTNEASLRREPQNVGFGINMKIEKNNFVVTFKTEKEVSDYMGMHIPEEQRLLWLGFFIANNYISQWLEDRQEKKK